MGAAAVAAVKGVMKLFHPKCLVPNVAKAVVEKKAAAVETVVETVAAAAEKRVILESPEDRVSPASPMFDPPEIEVTEIEVTEIVTEIVTETEMATEIHATHATRATTPTFDLPATATATRTANAIEFGTKYEKKNPEIAIEGEKRMTKRARKTAGKK